MAIKLDRSKLTQGLATGHKLVPHIDRAIGEREYEWTANFKAKEHDDAWHPSGDCTPGLLELYAKATGQGEAFVPSVSLRKTFMVGHFWHAYLQFICSDVLEFCEPESVERRGSRIWRYKSNQSNIPRAYHWATGSGDLAPVSIPSHRDYLVDFKTMSAFDFKLAALPERFAAKYECQINIYMDLFDLEKALIVGINKDSPHDMKEFEYTRNQPLIDAIYHKWELVSACLDAGVEPPADEVVELPLRSAT